MRGGGEGEAISHQPSNLAESAGYNGTTPPFENSSTDEL